MLTVSKISILAVLLAASSALAFESREGPSLLDFPYEPSAEEVASGERRIQLPKRTDLEPFKLKVQIVGDGAIRYQLYGGDFEVDLPLIGLELLAHLDMQESTQLVESAFRHLGEDSHRWSAQYKNVEVFVDDINDTILRFHQYIGGRLVVDRDFVVVLGKNRRMKSFTGMPIRAADLQADDVVDAVGRRDAESIFKAANGEDFKIVTVEEIIVGPPPSSEKDIQMKLERAH